VKEDSIEGIYDTLKECAVISKSARGIGVSVHNIRSMGSYIRGPNGTFNAFPCFVFSTTPLVFSPSSAPSRRETGLDLTKVRSGRWRQRKGKLARSEKDPSWLGQFTRHPAP